MSSAPVEEIKARLDIAEIVGESVSLRQSGRSLKGLCPFHTEKTPSFYVFPETGTWHCFGCGEGGDHFTFLEKRDRLEFKEALGHLARRAGVDLPSTRTPTADRDAHERLYRALEAAAVFYHALLRGSAGERCRAYLGERGITQATIDSFTLGFAANTSAALCRRLMDDGFRADELQHCGLARLNERGDVVDLLRDRLVFPIRDAEGRVIAFGGRALEDGVLPKYLNSPQSPLFDKGACLYGFDSAHQSLRELGEAVIVEGYVDVLAAHQAGFKNVVATLGTAVTERHLRVLRKPARSVVLALDADAAGQAATFRALEVARSALMDRATPTLSPGGRVRYQPVWGTEIKVVALPGGEDPDQLIRRSPEAWRALVSAAQPIVDFVLSQLAMRFDLGTATGKREAVKEALSVLGEIADPIERAHHLQQLAALADVPEAVLASQLRVARSAPGSEPALGPRQADPLEDYTLALLMHNPELADTIDPSSFYGTEHRAVAESLQNRARDSVLVESVQLRSEVEASFPSLGLALERQWQLVASLGSAQRVEELREKQRELLHRKLRLIQRHIVGVLNVAGQPLSEEERRQWQERLAANAAQIHQIQLDKEQLGRGRALVARYEERPAGVPGA